MPKIAYLTKTFRDKSMALIDEANGIIAEYLAQGFSLTLRQLYYQMVARGIIPNTQADYKRLGSLLADARMAGLVDWLAIEDRTRNLRGNSHWASARDIMRSVVAQYQIDKWQNQPRRVEVWIEKDALVGVIDAVCRKLDVPYFSCRGYTSASEMWRAGERILRYLADGQSAHVIHLGDHDPSGLDMTRDIQERLDLFTGGGVVVERIALNAAQIERYAPPPNPAKLSDSRAQAYVAEYGDDSWELDALEPQVIAGLIEAAVCGLRDEALWAEMVAAEEAQRAALQVLADSLEESDDGH